jgi:hypothetical protein
MGKVHLVKLRRSSKIALHKNKEACTWMNFHWKYIKG